jgi:hypothetical protein
MDPPKYHSSASPSTRIAGERPDREEEMKKEIEKKEKV